MLFDHNEPAQIKKGDVMVYPLSRYHNKYLFVVVMCVVLTIGMLTWWACRLSGGHGDGRGEGHESRE